MEIDLSIRLQACANVAETPGPSNPRLYAEAVCASGAAAAAVSAGIICSHTRILRGDSPPDYLLPGQDELDVLVADRPSGRPAVSFGDDPPDAAESDDEFLPLHPGHNTVAKLASGAEGIAAIKSRNG